MVGVYGRRTDPARTVIKKDDLTPTEHHMEELIAKYLAGEASPQEVQTVDLWVAENETHRHHFEQIKQLFQGATQYAQSPRFNADAAWERMQLRMPQPAGHQRTLQPVSSFKVYLRAAASLLLLAAVGIGAYFWLQKTDAAVMHMASETDVLQDTLPDGSIAFLNKASTLTYAYDASQQVRHTLFSGEAFFDVQHNDEEAFLIETADVFIEDIGTTFNVKAYPDAPTIEVYVASGEVSFYAAHTEGLHLTAGETGIYDKATQQFTKKSEVDKNVLAYKTRLFTFENNTLGDVVKTLNMVYAKPLRLENPALANCRLNVQFNNESVEVIADIIAETLHLTVTPTEHELVLDGTSCK